MSPWSNAIGGRSSTGCHRVSGGTSASTSAGTRPRYAVAISRRFGLRSGALQVPSCSRCESSRTSTFVARCRRIEASSVSSGARSPPGSDQAPAWGSRARSHSSTRSRPRTCSTTARLACAAVVGSITGFSLSVENLGDGAVMRIWKGTAVALGVLALAVAGCGGGDDEAFGTAAETGGGATSEAATDVKVGLVTDVGQLNDRGFNQLAFEGVKQAKKELGIEYRVIESASDSDYVPNMQALADDGYDLIVGVGFAQGEAIATVAKEYPDTKFAIIDVDQASLPGAPANVVGLLFKEEQAGYLAGVLAATVAKDEGIDSISSVGGMKEPPVDRFIAGYQAGAKATLPGITLFNGYSQDWDDVAKCKEVALDQISRGSKIVFQVAGGCGLGALDAAKQKSVFGIGVDGDQ